MVVPDPTALAPLTGIAVRFTRMIRSSKRAARHREDNAFTVEPLGASSPVRNVLRVGPALLEVIDSDIIIAHVFRALTVADLPTLRCTCRRISRIPVQSFLRYCFEETFEKDELRNVISEKFCKSLEHWPVRVLPLLLQADGVDINQRGAIGQTLLWEASINRRLDTAAALIAARADVNLADVVGRTPLWIASHMGVKSIVDALVTAGADMNLTADDGGTPLLVAVDMGSKAIVEALVAAGADVNIADEQGQTPLSVASARHTEGVASGESTALSLASYHRNKAIVDVLKAADSKEATSGG